MHTRGRSCLDCGTRSDAEAQLRRVLHLRGHGLQGYQRVSRLATRSSNNRRPVQRFITSSALQQLVHDVRHLRCSPCQQLLCFAEAMQRGAARRISVQQGTRHVTRAAPLLPPCRRSRVRRKANQRRWSHGRHMLRTREHLRRTCTHPRHPARTCWRARARVAAAGLAAARAPKRQRNRSASPARPSPALPAAFAPPRDTTRQRAPTARRAL